MAVSDKKPMKQRTLVPDAGEVVLDQLTVEDNCRLVMVLRAKGEMSCCPVCRQESMRIDSRDALRERILAQKRLWASFRQTQC